MNGNWTNSVTSIASFNTQAKTIYCLHAPSTYRLQTVLTVTERKRATAASDRYMPTVRRDTTIIHECRHLAQGGAGAKVANRFVQGSHK